MSGDVPLRVAVFLTTCAGAGALVAVELLAPASGAAGGALLALATMWSSRPQSTAARRWASTGLVGCTLLLGVGTLAVRGFAEAGTTLALLLLGLTVAHALVLETVRDLTVGLALGGAMVLVAAGLAPGPALGPPVAVGWVTGVTALVLARDLRVGSGVDGVLAAAAGDRPRGRVARAVFAAVAVGLLAFLLLPHPPSLSGLAARGGPAGTAGGRETTGRGAGAWSSGVLDMSWRGELSDAPVLTVPAGPPTLWRAAVLDRYDGRTWSSRQAGAQVLGSGRRAVPREVDDPPMPGERTRTDAVRPAGRPYDAVVAPGRAVTVDTGSRLVSADGTLYLAPPGQYTVTSVRPEASPGRLRAATGPDPSDRRWVDLPAGLPARVTALGRDLARPAPTRYDTVRAVERYLRGQVTYRLDSRVPSPGEDAVDAFLFTDRAGFCEQFAAAEVVLLRSAGIPARLVTGFSGGAAAGDHRVLREADAHAWVEVWFPRVGWVPSDPTAGTTLAASSRGWVAGLRSWAAGTLATSGGRLLLGTSVAAAGLVAVLVARLAARRRRRRRRRREQPAPATPPRLGALLTAYHRLEAALAAAGAPRRLSEDLADLADRLPGSSTALQTVSRGLYAESPPTSAESRLAIEALDQLAADLLASAASSATAPSSNRMARTRSEPDESDRA